MEEARRLSRCRQYLEAPWKILFGSSIYLHSLTDVQKKPPASYQSSWKGRVQRHAYGPLTWYFTDRPTSTRSACFRDIFGGHMRYIRCAAQLWNLAMLSRKHEADLLGNGTEGTVGAPRNGQLVICHESLYVRSSRREASLNTILPWPYFFLRWQW